MNKKKEAFELFNEGKRPSSPEVKALGVTAKTRYNYFQEWKKTNGEPTNDFNEISELKAEKARLTLLTQIEELETRRAKLPSRISNIETQFVGLIEYLKKEHKNMVELLFMVAAGVSCVRSQLSEEETRKNLYESNDDPNCRESIEDGVKQLETIKDKLRWQ